jgi:hypothetical protein
MQKGKIVIGIVLATLLIGLAVAVSGCFESYITQPQSTSGVSKVSTTVPVGANGLTVEQNNIAKRLALDNQVGSIKYLYVFSTTTGDCLLSSVVDGKVTSSGKRLSPYTVAAGQGGSSGDNYGIPIDIGGNIYRTTEVLQDDGTYGSSVEYLYWFDTAGNYRQIYPNAGTFIVVSDTPITVPKTVININGNEKAL